MIQGPGGNLSAFQDAQVQPGGFTESVVVGESEAQSSTETESMVQYQVNEVGGEPRRPLSTSEHKVRVRAVTNFIHPNKLTVTVTVTVWLTKLDRLV